MSEIPGAPDAPETAPLSVDDAVARLREQRAQVRAPAADDQSPPERAPAAGDDQADEADDAAGAEDHPDDDDGEATAGEPRFRVKVDGEDRELPVSELISGYQRARDYTHKTQQLGQERQQVEQQRAQLLEMQATIQRVLEAARPGAEPELQPPDPKLADTDPVAWIRQKAAWDQHQAQRAEQSRLRAQAEQQAQAQLAQHLQREAVRLAERIPGWQDEAARPRLVEEIRSYAVAQLGFTAEELQHAYDSRIVEAIWKAKQFDALQGGRVQPTAPPGQRPVMTNGASVAPSAVRRASAAFKAAPTVDSAVALLRAKRGRNRPV
jgi:hypothetical protein